VGQLGFDPNRHAELSARGDSLVLQVPVSAGDEVRTGQALVVLASSAVGAEQARLVAAKARVETAQAALARETGLAVKRVNARRDVEDARRELAAAVADRDSALAGLRATGASPTGSGGRYSLLAPFAGTVVTRTAAPGMTAAAGQVLVELADVRSLVGERDVPDTDAALVRPGQQVELTLEGGAASFEGGIASVAAVVDPQSRTVRARVRVDNPDRTLRAGLFVRGRIRLEAPRSALLVPVRAVQHVQGRPLVFVRKEPTLYEPVAVRLGATDGGLVEVLEGVSPGADVVTTGAFLLKTEILKGSIGAGCCEEAPGS
jgi:cobalt-zinc-cadmium efflux system membrane fusion protein